MCFNNLVGTKVYYNYSYIGEALANSEVLLLAYLLGEASSYPLTAYYYYRYRYHYHYHYHTSALLTFKLLPPLHNCFLFILTITITTAYTCYMKHEVLLLLASTSSF